MVQIADDGEPQLQGGGRQRLVVRAVRHVALRGEKAATLARRAGRGGESVGGAQGCRNSFRVSVCLFGSSATRGGGQGRGGAPAWPIYRQSAEYWMELVHLIARLPDRAVRAMCRPARAVRHKRAGA